MTTPDGPVVTRRWGRFGFIFAAAWTVFLFQPFLDGWAARDQVRGWIGMIATLAFAVTYLAMFRWSHTRRAHNEFRPPLNQAVPLVLALFGLAAVMVVAVGSSGLSAGVFLAVSAVMLFPAWLGGLTALTVAVLVEVISTVMDWGSGTGLSLGVCAAAFAMFGVTKLINRNIELVREREASERLAVQEERTRMARDLHDILGHSLTVITVKAELVGRLLDIDIDRARTEVADLERLSRDALADVRQAVQGIRGLSLPVEIARAGEALRSESRPSCPTAPSRCPPACASCSRGRSARVSPTWSGTAARRTARSRWANARSPSSTTAPAAPNPCTGTGWWACGSAPRPPEPGSSSPIRNRAGSRCTC
ncbi:histidine kinase [Rhodococcus opacus]|nr:histidine kinase [Rhodococcus opacus]